MAPGRLRSTKVRVLGRVKVWHASSFSVRYASVSTMIPEHFPQTNSVPMSSRAQTNGSRSKKEHGRKADFATRVRLRNAVLALWQGQLSSSYPGSDSRKKYRPLTPQR